MNNSGKVFVDRKILEWEWYTDLNTKSVFLHLLLTVNWKSEKFKGFEIKRGERIASYSTLAEESGMSVRSVRTAVDHLKSTGELTNRRQGNYTVFTLVNYNKYQQTDKPSDKPPTNESTNHRQMNRQTTDNDRIIYNNIINKKEKKDIIPPPLTPPPFAPERKRCEGGGSGEQKSVLFEKFWEEYPKSQNRNATWEEWKKASELMGGEENLYNAVNKTLSLQIGSADWKKENGRYIPLSANYLKNKRWEDRLNRKADISDSPSYDLDIFQKLAVNRRNVLRGNGDEDL